MKYGFIGCGNMGGAIAKALSLSTKDIAITDRSGKAKALAEELGVSYSGNAAIAGNCDRIFLGVKPHMMAGMLSPLAQVLAQRKPLLITMAAGLEISRIESFVGVKLPVIRIMPNTPTAIGKGVIPYCCNELVSDEMLADWLADMQHCGLLDALDEEDSEYGTKMARLLHSAQQHGIKTSIDVVSEAGDRFRRLVCPAMKYTDYCIINEMEASATTGVELRTEDGKLLKENMPEALKKMKEMGVSTWAVIHCPEVGYGLDENDNLVEVPSLKLPDGWIAGTVGAGDAFCSGVLYGAWKGMDLKSAIELGTASAVCSLSQPGATEGMRSVAEAMKVYNELR